MRAADLVVGRAKKAESKRKHFSVSTAGSPTQPLTPAVNCNDIGYTFCELESSKTRLNLAFSDDFDM
jgi:hypothetical protein